MMKPIQNQTCSKPECEHCGKRGINIGGYGWFTTKSGRRRRYRCKICGGTRRVQEYKRTQDWRAGPFRSSSPRGEPQIWGVSEAMSGDSGSPYAQGKHHPATGCHVPGRRPGSRPGPHLDQNVLGQLRRGSPDLDFGPLRWPFFPPPHGPVSVRSPIGRKRGTRKSGLETNTENEARSVLLARLWCHVILQNRANGAENLTRLCSVTIGQTGWRMVQSRAIRSRQKVFWQFWESGSNFWPCAWLGQCSENSEKP